MQLKPVSISPGDYPADLRPYLSGGKLFDSSCSQDARVIYIEKDGGYFLKTSASGSLEKEYLMTQFYHSKGLAAAVIQYQNDGLHDYLLTKKVRGDDCTAQKYLEDPKRLCDTLGEILARLHSIDPDGCPVPDHTERYKAVIEQNHGTGCFDLSYSDGFSSPDEAYSYVKDNIHLLEHDALLHGDYCLPNVILDSWRFSGFVDVGNGGAGDRHIDLYWGAWSLRYNLGTDKYRQRFFDAYGRDKVDEARLRLIGACEVFG